jgi:hypothetical protein
MRTCQGETALYRHRVFLCSVAIILVNAPSAARAAADASEFYVNAGKPIIDQSASTNSTIRRR